MVIFAPPGVNLPGEDEPFICSKYEWSTKVVDRKDLTEDQKATVERLLNASYNDKSGLRGGNMLTMLSQNLKNIFQKMILL